jgi:hypothetical protein
VKTIFIRLGIVWLMAGQILLVCWPHLRPRQPSDTEREYARDPASPQAKTAMEHEFDRMAEYETKRDIALISMLLAGDAVIIFAFWSFGAGRRKTAVEGETTGK